MGCGLDRAAITCVTDGRDTFSATRKGLLFPNFIKKTNLRICSRNVKTETLPYNPYKVLLFFSPSTDQFFFKEIELQSR